MQIKSIMRSANQLVLLNPEETAKSAIEKIDKGEFLSLPVVENGRFLGFLSKQFIYERFFSENSSGNTDIDAFLSRKVRSFLAESKVAALKPSDSIEDAALRFSINKLRFLPVENEEGEFVGIVTQQALFGILVKAFGVEDPKLVVITDGISGVLTRIGDIIAKHGGNITNVIQLETEVPNVDEVSFRVVGADIEILKQRLTEKGFRVK